MPCYQAYIRYALHVLQTAGSGLRPRGRVLALIGGADVLGKAEALAYLLHCVDEIAVGGVLGIVWAHVAHGGGLGQLARTVGADRCCHTLTPTYARQTLSYHFSYVR